jgi:hypothetical protein
LFADIKIIPTFASAITKKVLYKANEGRFSKRVSESKNEEMKKKLQKVLEIFGGFKNMLYLCTTFAS